MTPVGAMHGIGGVRSATPSPQGAEGWGERVQTAEINLRDLIPLTLASLDLSAPGRGDSKCRFAGAWHV